MAGSIKLQLRPSRNVIRQNTSRWPCDAFSKVLMKILLIGMVLLTGEVKVPKDGHAF